MVSTRGVRYKFSEGERVLCYEPDPTKAKVLYDSKVLEVIESKDKRGRRTVEYLIHFQGWNSSWDRCVSEDFVLKDTEENRQLQKHLAEKSQLHLGAYLYRRERKKGSAISGSGPAKRARHGFSDDGSSSSTQPDGINASSTDGGETGDTDSSGSGSAESGSQRHSPLPITHIGRAHIALPSALRDRLTFDYHLVVKRGLVSRLPASPSAAQVLESFVKWFARAGAWRPPPHARLRHDPPQRPDLLDVSCRLNLVREVADGLRVYFDFILRGHLLYKQEISQYHEMCGQYIDNNGHASQEEQPEDKTDCVKTEPDDEDNQEQENLESNSQDEATVNTTEEVEDDLKSPKIPEYSHLPPDPVDGEKSEVEPVDTNSEEGPKLEATEKSASKSDSAPEDNPRATSSSSGKSHDGARAASLARRLRSHKSAVSQSENDEPAPSTSTSEPRIFETHSSSVGSSGSSMSESWSRPQAGPAPRPPPSTRTPLSLLLDKVAKWQIIPREGTEKLPCRVYGAIHLARLFVKLPDFLNATQMPDFKLKLLLKHIDMFIQYLDEHSEWFGEMYYISDNVSRSH